MTPLEARKCASILSPLVTSQFVHSHLLSSHLSPSLRWDTRREESRQQTFNKMTYLCFGGKWNMTCGTAASFIYCLVIASHCFMISVRQCLWRLIYSEFNSQHDTMCNIKVKYMVRTELYEALHDLWRPECFIILKKLYNSFVDFLLQLWLVYSSGPLLCHRCRKDYKGYTCASSLRAPPASPRCILGIDYPPRCVLRSTSRQEDGRD